MNNMIIEKLLVQKVSEVEHFDTPELRTKELLEALENEYNNNRNIVLISSTKRGHIEMLDEMDKIEILSELDYAIKLLTRFQETGKFDIVTVP